MKRTRLERKHVEFFCEGCGKVEFEGRVFGRDAVTHLQAASGDRTMYCTSCRPPLRVPKIQFSSFFDVPADGE